MATQKFTQSIAGGARVNIDLGPLGAPVGPQGGRARMFGTQPTATGDVLYSLGAGTRFPISNADPNVRTNGAVLRNEDGIGEVIAGPFQVFTLTVENTQVGAIVASILLDVDGIPGT